MYIDACANANKSCRSCFSYNKYKPPKQPYTLGGRKGPTGVKKEGMAFEERGTKRYNQAIREAKDVARRQIASGGKHWALGDMITEEELTASLAEFKERGTISASGEKQITIKKQWLDKLSEEAEAMNRSFYFLPFTFKGQDTDYVAMEYDRFLAYVQMIQTMAERMRILEDKVVSLERGS